MEFVGADSPLRLDWVDRLAATGQKPPANQGATPDSLDGVLFSRGVGQTTADDIYRSFSNIIETGAPPPASGGDGGTVEYNSPDFSQAARDLAGRVGLGDPQVTPKYQTGLPGEEPDTFMFRFPPGENGASSALIFVNDQAHFVYSEHPLNDDQLNNLTASIRDAGPNLYDTRSNIYVMDELGKVLPNSLNNNTEQPIAGLEIPEGVIIRTGELDNLNSAQFVLDHEFSHHQDSLLGRNPSQNAYGADGNRLFGTQEDPAAYARPYAQTNSIEDFAESGRMLNQLAGQYSDTHAGASFWDLSREEQNQFITSSTSNASLQEKLSYVNDLRNATDGTTVTAQVPSATEAPPAQRPPDAPTQQEQPPQQNPPTQPTPPQEESPPPHASAPPEQAPAPQPDPPPEQAPAPQPDPPPEQAPAPQPDPSPEQAPAPQPDPPPEQAPAPQPDPPPEQAPAPQPDPPPEQVPAPQPDPPPEQAPAPQEESPPQPDLEGGGGGGGGGDSENENDCLADDN